MNGTQDKQKFESALNANPPTGIGKNGRRKIVIDKNIKYGLLTPIKMGRDRHNLPLWECICDCGKTTYALQYDLDVGKKWNCGCINLTIKHRLSHHPLYMIWAYMLRRCKNNPKRKNDYKNYFLRGIRVCDDWGNFENFYKWAKDKWVKGLEIDRIDNNNGYSPDNCRFVTRSENVSNSRNGKYWVVNNILYESAPKAAAHEGVGITTIHDWCNGYTSKYNKYYSPRQGCFSIRRYVNV